MAVVEPVTGDTPAETAKFKFWLDGKFHALMAALHALMAALSARGPDPDFRSEDEIERVARLIAREAARSAVEVGTYNEGGGGGQKWLLTVCGGLAVAGIITTVGMYGKLAAIEANQTYQQQQITEIKQQLNDLRQFLRDKP